MNPSVVAAHKRIGLLQRFNKWQGKAMEKMQKSMDKMVSKIKSLEKKVSGSSSKKKNQGPTFPRSRSLLTTQRRLPAQEPHRASSFEPREGKTTRREGGRRPRPDAPARPPDSIESKQRKLNSIELRVELTWKSPCLKILDSSTINAQYQDFSQTTGLLQPLRASTAPPRPREPHTLDEEEEEEEPQARSSEEPS
ncbi:unnamed protein product [Microthlaspi erraticum]|uniref:Uncharacterized protein n=1 Tax=Microthlaspi erraticum TaxID=1685480 RepID=A0A6D2K9U6_9BRAS|nr:unnamed protein product [Microthlaspi erraticum]